MAICEIHHTVMRNERSPFGQGTAVSWCTTHSMQVPDAQTQGLCPLGRIEEAAALAIERIDQQTEQSIRRLMAMQVQLIRQMEMQHGKED
jgi:hypothetical protein